MYVRKKGGYDAFPLMIEVTSIHAPKIMKRRPGTCRDGSAVASLTRMKRETPANYVPGRMYCGFPGTYEGQNTCHGLNARIHANAGGQFRPPALYVFYFLVVHPISIVCSIRFAPPQYAAFIYAR